MAHDVVVSNTYTLMVNMLSHVSELCSRKMLPALSLFVSLILLGEPVQNLKCLVNLGTSVPSCFALIELFFPHDPGQTCTISNFWNVVLATSII